MTQKIDLENWEKSFRDRWFETYMIDDRIIEFMISEVKDLLDQVIDEANGLGYTNDYKGIIELKKKLEINYTSQQLDTEHGKENKTFDEVETKGFTKAQLKKAIDTAFSEGIKNGQIVAGRGEETWHYNNRILPLQDLYKQFGVD